MKGVVLFGVLQNASFLTFHIAVEHIYDLAASGARPIPPAASAEQAIPQSPVTKARWVPDESCAASVPESSPVHVPGGNIPGGASSQKRWGVAFWDFLRNRQGTTYIHLFIHTYIHLFIHNTYIHTYIHTHTHTHTYISNLRVAFDKLMSSRNQGLTGKQKEERAKIQICTSHTIYRLLSTDETKKHWFIFYMFENNFFYGNWKYAKRSNTNGLRIRQEVSNPGRSNPGQTWKYIFPKRKEY